MAKKKTTDSENSPTPTRTRTSAPRRAVSSASTRGARVTAIDTAPDMAHLSAVARGASTPNSPSYHEIAEAAYHRYLQRGAQHGADFDDWVEAERELRSRNAS